MFTCDYHKTILVFFLAILLFKSSVAQRTRSDFSHPCFTGAFIQYSPDLKNSSAYDWEKELSDMHIVGIDTGIIQFIVYKNDGVTTDYLNSINDPTIKILEAAKALYTSKNYRIRIYLGLWLDQDNWHSHFDSISDNFASYFDSNGAAAQYYFQVIDKAWEKYKSYNDYIAGWYLPQEIYSQQQLDRQKIIVLRNFFSTISKHCKSLDRNNLPVTMSPIITTNTIGKSPEATILDMMDFFEGKFIDDIFLQDGVGAKCWHTPEDFSQRVRPYYEAYYEACSADKVGVYANIEIFQKDSARCGEPHAMPASMSRIKDQFTIAYQTFNETPEFFKGYVNFAFYNYMSPNEQLPGSPNPDKTKRTQLYNDYKLYFEGR